MGDALCGPSNALQTFKSHTSVDRTLQQDRLVSRQAPSRGFRSQDPNAGILDPEFEAFQAGHPGALSQPDLPVFHPGQRFQQPHHGPSIVPGFAGPSQAPDWAADFQRMRISQSPLPQHFSPVPQAQNATWDGIFQRHSPGFQKASNMSPSPLAFHNRAQYGMNGGFAGGYSQQQLPSQGIQAAQEQQMDLDQFDDAAFERAFDAAHQEMAMLEGEQNMHMDMEGNALEQLRKEQEPQERQTRTLPDGGIDIYPHLTLLRLRMFDCISQGTEESMANLSICLSLLEQVDEDFIDPVQACLTIPVLNFLSEQDNIPYDTTFKNQNRAAATLQKFSDRTAGLSLTKKEQELAHAYLAQLPARFDTNHLSSYENDARLRDLRRRDVESTLNELRGLALDEQMQTVIPPHWQDRVGQDGRMNALISLASLERANQGLAQTDWPLSALAADAQAMAQAPEMIEAQEGLAARNFSLEEYQRQLREDELSGQSALEAQTLEQMRESALQSELQHLEDIQEQGKRQEQQNRDDELAQTAADLLAKVSDNKTSKFQNSAFLGLMRKLADHQVKVEGDKMVETGSTPLSDQVPDLRPVAVDNGYRPPMLHRGSSQDNQRPPLPLHDADVDAASNTIRDGQAVVDLLNQPGAEEPPAIEDQGEHFSLNEYWIDAQEDVWASQDPSVPGRRLPVGYMEQLRNLQNRFLVPQHEEDRE